MKIQYIQNERLQFFPTIEFIFKIADLLNIIFGIVALSLEYDIIHKSLVAWSIALIICKGILSWCLLCGCHFGEDEDRIRIFRIRYKLLGLPFFIIGVVILSLYHSYTLTSLFVLIYLCLYIPIIMILIINNVECFQDCLSWWHLAFQKCVGCECGTCVATINNIL
jgi:hypothetical protein